MSELFVVVLVLAQVVWGVLFFLQGQLLRRANERCDKLFKLVGQWQAIAEGNGEQRDRAIAFAQQAQRGFTGDGGLKV